MPLAKYTWRHPEGHEVIDQELFPHTSDIFKTILTSEPIFKNPQAQLLRVEIINPLIHEHNWQRTAKQGERVYFKCAHCGVVAWRRYSVVYGLRGGYNREDSFKASKYETCRSPLKEMPASTKLF